MDAIETVTQTEPGMTRGGIGTGRRWVGGKPEIQSGSEDELSARCVDRVLEMRRGTRSGSGTESGTESGRKSASGRGRRTRRGRGRGRGLGRAGK